MRVHCWDCYDEPGAWSACKDLDLDSNDELHELTNSLTNVVTPLVISSALISPPVDGGPQNGVEEGQGFYMLKKDSQRRQTIVKVLQDDRDQVGSLANDQNLIFVLRVPSESGKSRDEESRNHSDGPRVCRWLVLVVFSYHKSGRKLTDAAFPASVPRCSDHVSMS